MEAPRQIIAYADDRPYDVCPRAYFDGCGAEADATFSDLRCQVEAMQVGACTLRNGSFEVLVSKFARHEVSATADADDSTGAAHHSRPPERPRVQDHEVYRRYRFTGDQAEVGDSHAVNTATLPPTAYDQALAERDVKNGRYV